MEGIENMSVRLFIWLTNKLIIFFLILFIYFKYESWFIDGIHFMGVEQIFFSFLFSRLMYVWSPQTTQLIFTISVKSLFVCTEIRMSGRSVQSLKRTRCIFTNQTTTLNCFLL